MPRLLATTISGFESITKYEILERNDTLIRTEDRSLVFDTTDRGVYSALISSRYANRIYLVLGEWENIDSFDAVFAAISTIDYTSILPVHHPIHIGAASIRSKLESIPTLQKIGAKALFSSFSSRPLPRREEIHIELLLKENRLTLLLDITGDPLHKRGYRRETNEAPIKETLAAGLITLAGYRGDTIFADYFCGSGTIAIEAALIALNIAPGLFRSFRIECLPWYDAELDESVRSDYEFQIKPQLTHPIYASDIDPEMITLSQSNAHRANVRDHITFRIGDAYALLLSDLNDGSYIGSVVNPPYGDRMQETESTEQFLTSFFDSTQVFGGFISNSESDYTHWSKVAIKNRKLQHGGKMAYFYHQPLQKSCVKKEERK